MAALRSSDTSSTAPAQAATTTTATAKRTRRRVGPEQLKALENAYDDNPYPDETTRDALAARVQMEPKAVSVWFQNKRQAERKQSLHAATTAANAGLAPPPVAVAHPGRRRRVPPPRKAKSGSPTQAEEEIDELADDTDGDEHAVKRESLTPPATVATSSANSSRAGSVRPITRQSGSGLRPGSASASRSASASSATVSAKAALARSASVSIPAATTSHATKPLPRTASLSDIQAQPKSLARAASLSELPKQQQQQQQSGPTGVVYHVYPMPPGGYYPAYGMGMGMYGYGYGMGMGMGMGYYDSTAWGSPPVPPTPVLTAAERDRGTLSRTPSLASSSSTLISRTPSLASTLGGSSPTVDVEDGDTTPPAKKRPRQLYDLMASSSPPPEDPEPEPRRRRTLEWACAKDGGAGDAQDALRKARAKELKEKREREARRAQEEDDTAMAAMLLVGLRGG